MAESFTHRRFQGEAEYQEEKLRNLFTLIYRDSEKAWSKWLATTDRKGLDTALQRFDNAPRKFGKLKGRVWLGMFPGKEFKRRQLSVKELKYSAEKWQTARMQLKLAESKLQRETERSKRSPDIFRDLPERDAPQPDRNRDRGQTRERGRGGRS